MIGKTIKLGLVTAGGLTLLGGLAFGTDFFSYAKSSASQVQTALKDSVPIDFELRRARDLLSEIVPEMHANIKLIAQEEVQIKQLESDIAQSQQRLNEQEHKVARIRQMIDSEHVVYSPSGNTYTRPQLVAELGRRFDHMSEAKVILAGKVKLLDTRQKSLQAAMGMLDKTRGQKLLLEDKIESLESQYRLVQAAAVGSKVQFDNSKLAQTEKLINDIKTRLDTAERVLAHEAKFTGEDVELEIIDERDILGEVDAYLNGPTLDENQTSVNPSNDVTVDTADRLSRVITRN